MYIHVSDYQVVTGLMSASFDAFVTFFGRSGIIPLAIVNKFVIKTTATQRDVVHEYSARQFVRHE